MELENRRYQFRLYVAGATPHAVRAIQKIRRICEEHMKGRYTLEVIDVYKNPHLTGEDQVVATPTLIKIKPAPARRLVGVQLDPRSMFDRLEIREGFCD